MPETPTSGKTIFIAENDLAHLDLLKKTLANDGYSVRTATDGAGALAGITGERPGLVLLDLLLPSLDGFQIMDRLREEGIDLPVIIIADTEQRADVDRALNIYGARSVVFKPDINKADVLAKVRAVMAETRAASPRAEYSLPISSLTKNQRTSLLLVEDDKFLRELLVKKLKGDGFTIIEAVDGESALRTLEGGGGDPPQLVLLDLLLPGIHGFEVLKRIKANASTSFLPVVVLSNLGQEEDINKAKLLGAEDFLVKAKYTPAEIVARVKEILNKKYINQ